VSDRVIVVGGGLAGISAALRLADAGQAVTLLETRAHLGGAAFSFRRGELSVDNGQHVFLRCCEAYRWFLERIDAEHLVTLQDHLDIPVLRADGKRTHLRRLPHVPAPMHLSVALGTYALLGPADRLRAARGALALRRLDPSDSNLDKESLGAFLRRHGQNDATIAALWGIVATATLNKHPDRASLALAAKVFRTGLLDRADAADVGYARVPLGAVHAAAAAEALTAGGIEVRLRRRVEQVEPDGALQVSDSSGTHRLTAQAIVLAVPHADAFRIAPALATSPLAGAAGLGASPIVNVHLVYDRRVTDLAFAAAVDSPVQWLFDRSHSSGLPRLHRGAQYLAITMSAADDIVNVRSRAVLARFRTELDRLLPHTRRAEVLDGFVTRERRATFDQIPGSTALRPAPGAGLGVLRLAGAWTDTGWPDTMESAVRSGIRAAEAVLQLPSDELRRFAA
jgi:squalene-associated FAD-dependent desaturase